MTLGDIIRGGDLVVDKVTVKANEDIELGEMLVNDGNGFLAATAALASLSKPVVALEAHDYSEESEHTIAVGVRGVFEVQKTASNGAIVKGNKLLIGVTAGEVQVFAMADVTATVNETTAEAALLANQAAFGECYEDVATAATSVKIRI